MVGVYALHDRWCFSGLRHLCNFLGYFFSLLHRTQRHALIRQLDILKHREIESRRRKGRKKPATAQQKFATEASSILAVFQIIVDLEKPVLGVVEFLFGRTIVTQVFCPAIILQWINFGCFCSPVLFWELIFQNVLPDESYFSDNRTTRLSWGTKRICNTWTTERLVKKNY